ncbi:MAG TPA: Gfo/Idh/MocA family oxidoreductase [Aggregatilineales bacterium]|nr:Gfo/Idh/MocA family oxidoreductase [Aggregatilineales bacterium]
MMVILVGAGSFGFEWYKTLKADHPELTVVVADRDPAAKARIDAGDRFYPSLREAVEAERPDFLLNATPPSIHSAVNNLAFEYHLPVLCEKPIDENYHDALSTVQRANQENIPFMIAENYRRIPIVRRVKKLIDEYLSSEIATIQVEFRKRFHTDKPYFLAMDDPLLADVAIHHLDMMRYFTGAEGHHILAKSYSPRGNWFKGNTNLSLFLEMRTGTAISYHGSLVSQASETTWYGNWTIEGIDRAITLVDDTITLIDNGIAMPLQNPPEEKAPGCLDDFLALLQKRAMVESTGTDYINTQALVHYSLLSSRENRRVEIELPTFERS